MSSPSEKEVSRHRKVAVLSKENSDAWFRQMRNWLEAEGIFWVIETVTPGRPSGPMPDLRGTTEGIDNLSLDDPPQGGTSNLATFKQKDAKAKYWIELSLNEFDQERVEDAQTARDMWTILQKKYKAKLPSTGRQYLAEYVNYRMESSTTIDQAWQDLSRLGRKVVEQNPALKAMNSTKERFARLLSALPPEYHSYKAGLDVQRGIEIEEALEILNEAEHTVHPEIGLYAKRPAGGFKQKDKPQRARSPVQGNDQNCYLCKGHGHQLKTCPYMKVAVKSATEQRRADASSRRTSDQVAAHSSDISQLKATINDLIKELKAAKAEKKSKKAYAAKIQESDSMPEVLPSSSEESQEETATFCKENVSTIIADAWISDSGASSHMTDNPRFFSDPPQPTARTTIKVGGGRLYSTKRGTVKIEDKSGSQLVLKDVLYVPDLGVNLLSGRKLCKEGLKGSFDDEKMYYLDSLGNTILEATERGGVYVLDKIAATYNPSDETEHFYTGHALNNQVVTEEGAATSDSDLEEQDQKVVENYRLYHRRFAHLGPAKISTIHKMTTHTQPIKIAKCRCDVCQETKMVKRKGGVADRVGAPLGRVSIDTCGPFPASREGFTQALVIKDDYTRMSWMIPVKDRKDCPAQLRIWKIKVEKQSGYLLKAVRIDNANELVKYFQELEKELGIEVQTTVPHTSTQNGLAERENRQIQADSRALLKDAKMPPEFWVDACQAGIYVRNRIGNGPVVNDHMISPYEAFTGRVPNVDHIRVWGCKVHSYMERESIPQGLRRDKLMDKSRIGVFVGYVADTSKQFLVWAPDRRNVIKSSNVTFHEDEPGGDIDLKFISKHAPSTAPDRNARGRPKVDRSDTLNPDRQTGRGLDSVGVDTTENDPTWKPTSVGADVPETDRSTRTSNLEATEGEGTTSASKPSWEVPPDWRPTQKVEVLVPANPRKRTREESDLTGGEDERATKIQKALLALLAASSLGSSVPPDDEEDSLYREFIRQYQSSLFDQELVESALNAQGKMSIPIPQTYFEAIGDKVWGVGWKEAVDKELIALAANHTWEVVTPPRGANIVTSKWVFNTKFNTDGSLEKLKARLVARGFSQKFGVDYEHTFAPTLRHDTLRVFMAICAMLDLECHGVDVNNAFTESFLKEVIYMKPPPGVDLPKGQCLKINRSLYGLKQAARDWNEKCVLELQKMGFVQSDADPCLLTHLEQGLILLVYVDDILVGGKELDSIKWFKAEFAKVFKIKDLGEVQKILGVHVTRDRVNKTITLDQGHYVKDILATYQMEQDKAKRMDIPMNGYDSLRPAEPSDLRADQRAYQTLIGKLLYLSILTRPDISFALGRLSQYLSDPAEFHMSALKRVLKYLRSTIDHGITFGGENAEGLVGYSDSDFASDRTDRLSILGNVFMLGNGPISWMSKKQKSVATSTMDAEYMAMCAASKQSQWLALVLREMGAADLIGQHKFKPTVREKTKFMIGSPVLIRGDNQAALGLVRDAQISDRSKHIDVAYHYQRDLMKKDRLKVEFVGTAEMVADGMTKPLAKTGFNRFLDLLGMRSAATQA